LVSEVLKGLGGWRLREKQKSKTKTKQKYKQTNRRKPNWQSALPSWLFIFMHSLTQ
jgi:hypothetical protein